MNQSQQYFERAQKVIPGGVNSPVRAFKSVGMDPIFVSHAHGAYITDVDGNSYIDYIQSWGPMILGHSPEFLIEGFEAHLRKGTSYGVPTPLEVEMAELLTEVYPAVEMIRMVNSGTEATMSALRLARGYTGRQKIVKFEGCYHGHSDALLVKSGSGTLTYGVPTSLGVPEAVVKDTLVLPYNDVEAFERLFEAEGSDIACVIVEPVAGNMGVVAGSQAFMDALRQMTLKHGAVLIFDEVITGFRIGLGGASAYYKITPDLTCFGKIIGGGLPVGAYGGKKEIMSCVSPLGGVYQAGTLSGNPLALYMGYKIIKHLQQHPEIYSQIEKNAILLETGLNEMIQRRSLPLSVVRVAGMVCLFFCKNVPTTYSEVALCDTSAYAIFFKEMLKRGVLLPPAQFEGLFLSAAHSEQDVINTLKAADSSFEAIK